MAVHVQLAPTGSGNEDLHSSGFARLAGTLDIALGQFAFVAAVLLVAAALRRLPVAWPQWSRAVPAYGIGTMAAFWFLQRAMSLM